MKTWSKLSQRSFVDIWSFWIFGSWESNIRTKLPWSQNFHVTKHPWSITAQISWCSKLLTPVKPCILELFVPKSAVSFTLSSAIVYNFVVDGFKGRVTLSGGSSGKESIERPGHSLASMASFKNILQLSYLNEGFQSWPLPKGFYS